MGTYEWPIVPICKRQHRDIRDEDLISGGLFRRCVVTRHRDQRDLFAEICTKRLNRDGSSHFVVQAYGCVLDCPYCYVTPRGIWGDPVLFSSLDLIHLFRSTGLKIFHLMGGAPGLYLEKWWEIVEMIDKQTELFHSDLLMVEKPYSPEVFENLDLSKCLIAINVKGVTPENYEDRTRTPFPNNLFWRNMDIVADYVDSTRYGHNPFYVTFTDPDLNMLEAFKEQVVDRCGKSILEESFVIDTVHYNALKRDDDAE